MWTPSSEALPPNSRVSTRAGQVHSTLTPTSRTRGLRSRGLPGSLRVAGASLVTAWIHTDNPELKNTFGYLERSWHDDQATKLAPLPHAQGDHGPTWGAGPGRRAQRKRDRRVRNSNIFLREGRSGGYRNLTPRIPSRRAPDASLRRWARRPCGPLLRPRALRAGVAPGGLRRRCEPPWGKTLHGPRVGASQGEGLPDGPHNRRSRLR